MSDSKEDTPAVPDTLSIKQKEQLEAYAATHDVLHNMTEKHKKLYEMFVADRAIKRAQNLEEDVKMRDMFLELGRQAFNDIVAGKQSVDDNKRF